MLAVQLLCIHEFALDLNCKEDVLVSIYNFIAASYMIPHSATIEKMRNLIMSYWIKTFGIDSCPSVDNTVNCMIVADKSVHPNSGVL